MTDEPAGSIRILPDLLRSGLRPEAVAVRDGHRTMTYRELDEASSRWARQLMAGGARPGEFVVVAVPRSLESVLALWAVAKAGACFAPVDPADPATRIAAVVADTAARQGLTVAAIRDALPAGTNWLALDDARTLAEVERRPSTPVDDDERPRALRPGHAAYLIYTAGATGVSKGVLVNHRGLGPLTEYITEHYGAERDSIEQDRLPVSGNGIIDRAGLLRPEAPWRSYRAPETTDDPLGVLCTLRAEGTRPPLFCVHAAVPLAWCYAGLARYITDRPVYGLQAPSMTGDLDALGTIDDLLDSYVDAMVRVQPEGPYHLLGWSLGGQIAHAIAVRLRAHGAAVAALTMLDSVVHPADAAPPPVPRMRDLLTHLLGDEPDDFDAAPEVTAVEAAAELAGAGAAFGTELSVAHLERLHRGYVDGVALSHSCRPGVFDGDLLYFSATRGMTEPFGADIWRPYFTGDLIEHPVVATHAQLTDAAVVEVIGPILARHLERIAVGAERAVCAEVPRGPVIST